MSSGKRRTSCVKFVSDEDVVANIININEKRTSTACKDLYSRSPKEVERNCEISLENKEEYHVPFTLLVERSELSGSNVFQFTSTRPKKAILNEEEPVKQPTNQLTNSNKKSQPSKLRYGSLLQECNVSLKCTSKKGFSSEKKPKQKILRSSTTKAKVKQSVHEDRPYLLRRCVQQELAKMSEDQADIEDSETDEDDNLLEDNCHVTSLEEEKFKIINENTGSSRMFLPFTEDYFLAHERKACKTSNHTLSRLEQPLLDHDSLKKLMNLVPSSHRKYKKTMFEEFQKEYDKWMILLSEGFNLLFYGFGSKFHLLDSFRKCKLTDTAHISVHGFFPGLILKHILTTIMEEFVGSKGNLQGVNEQVDDIRNHFMRPESDDLYIIIHNIDGIPLRARKNQSILSYLAQAPKIHIIASIDHINASLIWDQTQLSKFHWLWVDVTNFQPYTTETSFENSLLMQQSNIPVLSSLKYVFRSLTSNAQGIFLLITHYQLDQKDNSSYLGMPFQRCYQQCREAFLVNSELTLRAQLTEFYDHKLLRSQKGPDGTEYLLIPLDTGTLQQFLDHQDQDSN